MGVLEGRGLRQREGGNGRGGGRKEGTNGEGAAYTSG